MKRIQAKNGFMLVKTGIGESGLPFIVITRAISGPDNSDFSDWKELPEQTDNNQPIAYLQVLQQTDNSIVATFDSNVSIYDDNKASYKY